MVDPMPELPRAKRLGAEFRELGGKGFAAQPDKIAALINIDIHRLTSQALSINARAFEKPASE